MQRAGRNGALAGFDPRDADGDDPFFVSERVGGVRDQVHNDLPHLYGVRPDGGKLCGEIDSQNGVFGDRDLEQGQHFFHQQREIDGIETRFVLSRIDHQLANDLTGAGRDILDCLDLLSRRRTVSQFRFGEFGFRQDASQQVIEVMRDARSQYSQAFQFLSRAGARAIESGWRGRQGLSRSAGHGRGVSMEVYTISDHQQKREAVKKLESAVALKRKATEKAR